MCHIEQTWEEKPCEVMVQGGFQCKSSEVNENAQTMSSKKTLCVFVRAKIVEMIPSQNRSSHCIIISVLTDIINKKHSKIAAFYELSLKKE